MRGRDQHTNSAALCILLWHVSQATEERDYEERAQRRAQRRAKERAGRPVLHDALGNRLRLSGPQPGVYEARRTDAPHSFIAAPTRPLWVARCLRLDR